MHYHDTQDELYFVHSGTARFEADGETREPGSGAGSCTLRRRRIARCRMPATRSASCSSIGAKDGYVGRDGQLVDQADLERRKSFGSANQ